MKILSLLFLKPMRRILPTIWLVPLLPKYPSGGRRSPCLPGFADVAGNWLAVIRKEGMRCAMEKLLHAIEEEADV